MAEEVAVATSEAPVVAETSVVEAVEPVVEAVEPVVEERKGPRTAKERDAAARENARKRREAREAAAQATEPVKEEVVAEVEENEVEEEDVVTGDAEQVDGEPGPEEAPAYVAVKIDPKNPSSQGQSEIKFADELSARVFRSYKNNDARQNQAEAEAARQELTTVRAELAQLHDKNDRSEADRIAWTKWEASDAGQAARAEYYRLEEMEKEGDIAKGTAAAYWRGASQGFQETAKVEYQTRAEARAAKQQERMAEQNTQIEQQWRAEAIERQRYLGDAVVNHPEFREWFDDAVDSFNDKIGRNKVAGLVPGDPVSVHNAFTKHFRAALFQHEAAIAALQSNTAQKKQQEQAAAEKAAAEKRRIAKIEQAAIEKYKAENAERRSTVPRPNPIGNLAGVSRDQMPVTPSGDGQDPSTMSPRDRKRARDEEAKARARDRYSRLHGT